MQNFIDIKRYILIEYAQNPTNAVTILSEYIKLYKIYCNKKSMEDAADCLNVSRGTLIKINKKKANLRMDTLTTIIDALVESRCPEPELHCPATSFFQTLALENCNQCPLVKYILKLSNFTYSFINSTAK